MKTIFTTLFYLLGFSLFAQIPPSNDECSHAIELQATDSSTVQPFSLAGATSNSNYPGANFCLGGTVIRDVWFKFTATEIYLRYHLTHSGYLYAQYFKGSGCDSLRDLQCLYDSILGPLEIGKTYYIRIWEFYSLPGFNGDFSLGIQKTGLTHFLSNEEGGDWLQKPTWVLGKIPTEEDSVEIAEGAKVNFINSYYQARCRYLRIGGRNNFRSTTLNGGTRLYAKKGILLGEGDSLASNFLGLHVGGSCNLDGTAYCDNLGLYFYGNHDYDFKGSGNFLVNQFSGIFHFNSGETTLKFGGDLQGGIFFGLGKIKFQQPINFKLMTSIQNFIWVYQGKFDGAVQFDIPPNFNSENGALEYHYGLWDFYNLLLADYSFPLSPELDTISKPGAEFINAPIRRNIMINKALDYQVFGFDSSLHFGRFSVRSGKIRMKNPNDTVFTHNAWFTTTPDNSDKALRNICLYEDPAIGFIEGQNSVVNHFGIQSGGKYRNLILGGVWNTEPGQKICPEVIPDKPTGNLNFPLTKILGANCIKINSARPIPGGNLKITLYKNPMDSIFVPGEELVLAQASSPSGPWTKVSNNLNFPNVVTVGSNPVFFENGRYFCFATTAKGKNMTLFSIIPPIRYYQTGCPFSPSQSVGVVVRNYGYEKAGAYTVYYQVGNGQVHQLQVQYPTNRELSGGQKDTIWFHGNSGFAVTAPGEYSIKAWVKFLGDNVPENDSLTLLYNTNPLPLPYKNDFDTVAHDLNPYNTNTRNIPFRWFDDVYYHHLLNYRAEGVPFPNLNYYFIDRFSTSNKRLAGYFSRPSSHTISTHPIGPLPATSVLALKYNIRSSSVNLNALEPGDTLFVEATSDCGIQWFPLFKLHHQNIGTNGGMNFIRDSLPFPQGATISIRFRNHIQASSNQSNVMVYFDSLLVSPGILSQVNSNQNLPGKPYLYPNPAQNRVFIKWPGLAILVSEYRIFDVNGRLVQKGKLENGEIPIASEISPGWYQVQIISDGQLWNDRILISD